MVATLYPVLSSHLMNYQSGSNIGNSDWHSSLWDEKGIKGEKLGRKNRREVIVNTNPCAVQ
jgi:hypothetical protein